MIEASGLSKRYGGKTAVDNVSFTVQPGKVTGFLGPNGAGKSTTMRMIVGLDRPTAGKVLVNGKPYAQHKAPLREVGALLDAKAVHTKRSAYNHLRAMAATHGISTKRINEVIELTGLSPVAKKRVGGFSLGMGQRLGIAVALLGDPHTVILDEPVNGLDPEGVLWVRHLARGLASEGRTVFLSSHLMSEMAQTADHLIVIGRGRIIADAPISEIIAGEDKVRTLVRTDSPRELLLALDRPGVAGVEKEGGLLEITGADPRLIAETALERRILVYELTPQQVSLEDAYMELTRDDVEYRSQDLPQDLVPAGAASGKGN
ncbi:MULTISPECIES: ABC transporter ATP-binding protein [unclassified Arthrobacter]|uniref:ABC transporter ATP-binding protein n=1 Tax=unclassified Arthrobacter TaxID=235627 RepID=UPI002106FC94|nr:MULTISPECIES: ATP-binding cassette domain-containing protein [unclassified Arthrobacter]MCQ1946281.1 ATP-binding cassette domain-containing protein [Arthrobacter sp. zg-Y1116]MCQ1994039.1 ATP-binding cassette domain-containing protein [Arthrobacter sp. zg-Y1171]UWX81852.1 ATP-binding cassette domain-containing protein [Arthrobacter sp. zg-Y1171]